MLQLLQAKFSTSTCHLWESDFVLNVETPMNTLAFKNSLTAFQEGREEDNTETEVILEEDGYTINTAGQKKRKKPPAEEEELFKCALKALKRQQDDCDIFGEYVASELRSLKSDFNKRRLKSEIRKAVARIADEDDHCFASTSSFSPSSEYSLSPINVKNSLAHFLYYPTNGAFSVEQAPNSDRRSIHGFTQQLLFCSDFLLLFKMEYAITNAASLC
ncbi:hypothetical protein J437_LFUL004676 [Ladona fulva]|uniref:Uncharacterized protein n=1 Tax=Ladona fulva TaxID=123851 RepID=A0A8K0PAN6_LADFU|nr:hypothetical protein J437_LFUL004676 [Ladona fulva]